MTRNFPHMPAASVDHNSPGGPERVVRPRGGSAGGNRQERICALPESEAGAEPREVAAARLAGGRLTQAEEGMALHCALPQVFAGLGAGQLEHEGVLLLATLQGKGYFSLRFILSQQLVCFRNIKGDQPDHRLPPPSTSGDSF